MSLYMVQVKIYNKDMKSFVSRENLDNELYKLT